MTVLTIDFGIVASIVMVDDVRVELSTEATAIDTIEDRDDSWEDTVL